MGQLEQAIEHVADKLLDAAEAQHQAIHELRIICDNYIKEYGEQ